MSVPIRAALLSAALGTGLVALSMLTPLHTGIAGVFVFGMAGGFALSTRLPGVQRPPGAAQAGLAPLPERIAKGSGARAG